MEALSDLDTNKYQRIEQYKDNIKSSVLQAETADPSRRHYPQYNDQTHIKHEIKQRQKWLTPAEVEQIIELYKNGNTIYELADQFSCHRNTISHNLKKHGINVTAKKITDKAIIDNIITQYQSGLTIKNIAVELKLAESTVQKILKQNGMTMRTRWDYAQS